MRVGRRGDRGRRNLDVLRQRVEACRWKCPTVDDTVDHLRLQYPKSYLHGMELGNLTRLVGKIWSPPQTGPSDVVGFVSYGGSNRRSSRKKKKRLSDSSSSGSEVSTWERVKPESDIMKSMLRDIYTSGGGGGAASEEKNVETEVVASDDKEMSKVGVGGNGKEVKVKRPVSDSGSGSVAEVEVEEGSGSDGPWVRDLGGMEIVVNELEMEDKNFESEVVASDDKQTSEVGVVVGKQGKEVQVKRRVSGWGPGSIVEEGEGKGKDGPWFRDLGGMEDVVKQLENEVLVPLYHSNVFKLRGVKPIRGILLHGPPGIGKTKLAHAIANETGVPFYKISATEVVSGVSGASEENIRELFGKAYRTAPAIIYIDEIDAIASNRENLQKEMERRIVTQLMTCMDEYHKVVQPSGPNANSDSFDERSGHVLVIGATNRPDAIDPALRRSGRFDREIGLRIPDENARVQILSALTSDRQLEGPVDLLQIARSTPGFVGADLDALVNKAGNLAIAKIIHERRSKQSEEFADGQGMLWLKEPFSPEEFERSAPVMADFEEATKLVQPSLRREGFSSIPNVEWDDVGGLCDIRREFDRHFIKRIKAPETYQRFGVDKHQGILLFGPPGCGKTLIAQAVAKEAGANFIYIKGPELLNKYVGESELNVRKLFGRARDCSPCVIFFDEVDALSIRRGGDGGEVVGRVLTQLLTELDGVEQHPGVYVIGATNRPEVMDPAVLRSGRFGKHLYVPLPGEEDRGLILKALAKGKPIDASVDLCDIGKRKECDGFSGADLKELMNEAATAAAWEALTAEEGSNQLVEEITIKTSHFLQVLPKISPSVSQEDINHYKSWSQSFKRT